MGIHILSDDLAAKIAAGEVIERPASVVKELIENSIDAAASEIKVEIRGGGQRLMRVADDGIGIPADQVETAFAHHATSKIESIEDLFRLRTLGFRGEALASIAAVAQVTLITRARDEDTGTYLRIEGGNILEQHAQGAPSGTVITVEDLFRHVPARLKFLKTPATEAGRIADLINAYSLAYPGLRFSFVNDGRLIFQSPGTGNMFDAVVKVFGVETAKAMLEVGGRRSEVETPDGESPGDTAKAPVSNIQPPTSTLQLPPSDINVSGYISPPGISRGTRKDLLFFVNHRWIQDRALGHAVLEAYHTSLMVGRYPIAVVDISLPPDAVDVNVHPTKAEVRFRDPSAVFHSVQRAVRSVLTAHLPVPTMHTVPPFGLPDANWSRDPVGPDASRLALNLHRPIPDSPGHGPAVISPLAAVGQLPMLRVLGQIASTYIIAEGPEGLYLIDQHAAHERVLYEQLKAERTGVKVAVQELLDPITLPLTLAQFAVLEAHRDALASVGFQFEPFGGETVLLRAVPALLKAGDARKAVIDILEEIEQGEEPLEKTTEGRLIAGVCKCIAVKGGQVLSLEEMRELVRRLEHTIAPRTCPHGRPTMIQLSTSQLEREFGRK